MKFVLPAVLSAVVSFVCSCTSNTDLERSLSSAGPNRTELEAVLNHYRTVDNNPDKLRSAEFLIENMPIHYSYAGEEIYDYYNYAARILADTRLTPEQQRDSLLLITEKKYSDLPAKTVPDAQKISADYLIWNIDKSYEQWKTCPWANQVTFEQYLEWMLPYKGAELQEFDAWRDTLFAYYGACLANCIKNDVEYQTVMQVADTMRIEACNMLNRHYLDSKAGLPLLSDYLQVRQSYGNTPDYVLTALLTFRSAGLPAVIDETPVGARGTAATQWYVIYSDRGEEYTSEWDLSTDIGVGFFPYERGPKVYRNTYAINKEREEYLRKSKYKYPFELGKQDVTTHYFLTSNIEIPVKMSVRSHLKDKYVYIASAVRDENNPWQIVDFGKIRHGKACFDDMGREVLYVVMGYDGNKLIPITEPFILHKNERIEYVSAETISSPSLDRWKNNAL